VTDWRPAKPAWPRTSPGEAAEETNCWDCVAAREGLEPPTFALGSRRAISRQSIFGFALRVTSLLGFGTIPGEFRQLNSGR